MVPSWDLTKVGRLFEQALEIGEPFVYLGQTGGARIPDALGAEGLAMVPPPLAIAARRHRIPVATAIVGESFGGSSFIAGLSDFVVQTAGSCLAVTSPNVIAVATGERSHEGTSAEQRCTRGGQGKSTAQRRPLTGKRRDPLLPVVPAVKRVVSAAANRRLRRHA